MKRRGFLALLGAAGLSPSLPSMAAPAPVVAGYNRYMYGLAVFHARMRASVSAADLMARLKINAVQAEAMIGEMTAKGVIAPVANVTGGAMQTLDPHHRAAGEKYLRRAARRLADWCADTADGAEAENASGVTTTGMEHNDATRRA